MSIKIAEVETIPSVDQAMDSHTLITSSLKVAGCGLAAALYVLNKCPIHSRYVQRGIGKKQVYQVEQFKLHGIEVQMLKLRAFQQWCRCELSCWQLTKPGLDQIEQLVTLSPTFYH